MRTKSQWRTGRAAAAMAGAALMAPIPAAAVEYHLVSATDDLIVVLDKDSILRSGDTVRAWLTTIYRTPEAIKDLTMAFMAVKLEVDCANSRIRTISFAARDVDAVLVDEFDHDAAEWEAVESGKVTADWEAAICRPETLGEMKFPTTDLKVLRQAFIASD
jgi:hypothetical protein